MSESPQSIDGQDLSAEEIADFLKKGIVPERKKIPKASLVNDQLKKIVGNFDDVSLKTPDSSFSSADQLPKSPTPLKRSVEIAAEQSPGLTPVTKQSKTQRKVA